MDVEITFESLISVKTGDGDLVSDLRTVPVVIFMDIIIGNLRC